MKDGTRMKVGLLGCGDIARKAYLPFTQEQQDVYEVVALFDVRRGVAEQLAADFGIAKVHESAGALIADPEVEIVLNLTHPAGHAPLNLAALKAGKHAYCEKPFAITLDEGRAVLDEAAKRGLKVGCAPDTVLGPGTQACRKLIEDGALGRILSARLQFACPGHEHWHPNPAFYYQTGGGPLLDMGPYYLSFLVQTLGPVKSVMGRAVKGFAERPIRCGEQEGKIMPVDAPTRYIGSLETESGVVVEVLFSFDHQFGGTGDRLPAIFGERGALIGTNPNHFDGEPLLNATYAGDEFQPQPVPFNYEAGRGLGLVDMVHAIRENREPRCGGQMAYHLLEVMLAFEESERTRAEVAIQSRCAIPPAMPLAGC